MKTVAKTMPTRPPVAPIASSCASVRLREAAAERVGAGVAGDERPGVEPRDVPEARFVEVAEVDEDAELGAAP